MCDGGRGCATVVIAASDRQEACPLDRHRRTIAMRHTCARIHPALAGARAWPHRGGHGMRIVATTGRDSRVGDDVQCVIALYGNRTLTGSFMRTACTFVVMLSLVAVADVARAAQVDESVDGL